MVTWLLFSMNDWIRIISDLYRHLFALDAYFSISYEYDVCRYDSVWRFPILWMFFVAFVTFLNKTHLNGLNGHIFWCGNHYLNDRQSRFDM